MCVSPRELPWVLQCLDLFLLRPKLSHFCLQTGISQQILGKLTQTALTTAENVHTTGYSATATMICVSFLLGSFLSSEIELLGVIFCGTALSEGQKGTYLTQEQEERRELILQGRP